MQIEWINHAGFVLSSGATNLLIDPWLEGRSFNNSWELLSKGVFSYQDFARVRYIWFSHEHPDHFQPQNLRKIDAELRAQIVVLYQPTRDRRVISYCRSLGFADCIELGPEWKTLDGGLQVFCQKADFGDSWLAARDQRGKTLVNLNDCVFSHDSGLRAIKKVVGDVDLLVTQFSIASWWGNPDDEEPWRRAAQVQLDQVTREVEALGPRQLLLSASFVRFCHAENAYMNAYANSVATAVDHVVADGRAVPVVLYPGDRWVVGEAHDNAAALARYREDEVQAETRPLVQSSSFKLEELQSATSAFIGKLRSRNAASLLALIRPAVIRLIDLEKTVRLSLSGLDIVDDNLTADVELSSDALMFCLKNEFGGDTLFVSGRYRVPAAGQFIHFQRWFVIALANGRGVNYSIPSYYLPRLLQKLGLKIGAAPV